MIIGITGKAGSGKDTVADMLVTHFNFVKVALADPLKRICKEVFDFSDDQLWGPSEARNKPDERYQRPLSSWNEAVVKALQVPREYVITPEMSHLTPRYALQRLGTEWGRDCYPDLWVDYCLRVAVQLVDPACNSYGMYMYTPQEGLVSLYEQTCQGEWRRDDAPVGGRYKGVVIPDVRFINEAEVIRKAGGCIWCITRPSAGLKGEAGQHISETELEHIEADRTILNRADKEVLQHAVYALMRDDMLAKAMVDYLKKDGESATIPAPTKIELAPSDAVQIDDQVDFELGLQPSVTTVDGTQVLPDQPGSMDRLSGLLEERQRDVDAGKIQNYDPEQANVPPWKRRR